MSANVNLGSHQGVDQQKNFKQPQTQNSGGQENSFENYQETLSNNGGGNPISPRNAGVSQTLETSSGIPLVGMTQSGAGTVAKIDMRELINIRESFLKKHQEEEVACSEY